jgi:cation transport ATPase
VITPLVLAGVGFMGWRRARSGRALAQAPVSQAPDSPGSTAARADAKLAQDEAEAERFARRSVVLLAGTTAGALINPAFTVLTVPFLVVQALPLFREGYEEIRGGKLGGGMVRMLAGGGMLLTRAFWVLSLSGVLYGYIDRLQLRALRRVQRRLAGVFGELPSKAWVRRDGSDIEVALADVAVGDLVVVGAGQTIPADGRVESGEASIDQQALTGEAEPVEKAAGDSVLAATVVRSGSIAVRVERAGVATVVASLEEILNRTTVQPSAFERKSEVIADRSVAPTLALAALAQALFGSGASICTLAVYPGEDGMRLLGPLSVLSYVRHAAEQRILIKDGRVLESLLAIDTVVFDGAATLTEAHPGVASGDAALLVKALKARGMAVYILSGDRPGETERLALQLGVDPVVAGALPEQRAERIRAWRGEGKRVCFVGDGINDSIALRAADVSVSLTGPARIAADTASVVLLDGNLERLVLLFDLAKDHAVNQRHSLTALLAPSPLLVAGIFLLGFRTAATLLLTSAGALIATANASLIAERRLLELPYRPLKSLPAAQPMDEADAAASPAAELDTEEQLARTLGAALQTAKQAGRRLLASLDKRFGAAIDALGRTAERIAIADNEP